MTEQTLSIIKPDAVAAGHIGAIIARFEEAGLVIRAMDMRIIDGAFADRHYEEHLEKPFYPPLREFMTSGPLVPVVLEGDDAVERLRELAGATDPANAETGTIRADYGTSVRENAVHGSDSLESARREITLWFPNL